MENKTKICVACLIENSSKFNKSWIGNLSKHQEEAPVMLVKLLLVELLCITLIEKFPKELVEIRQATCETCNRSGLVYLG